MRRYNRAIALLALVMSLAVLSLYGCGRVSDARFSNIEENQIVYTKKVRKEIVKDVIPAVNELNRVMDRMIAGKASKSDVADAIDTANRVVGRWSHFKDNTGDETWTVVALHNLQDIVSRAEYRSDTLRIKDAEEEYLGGLGIIKKALGIEK